MINRNFFHIQRFPSHEVVIGDRPMGGQQPIRLQSMTNTNTLDVKATVDQCIRIIEAGADYVRISAPNIAAAEALREINKNIRKAGFNNPLIADIHFNADVALKAAQYVSKVRINPGNYTGNFDKGKTEFSALDIEQEKERIYNRLKPLVQICQQNGTAIRIGTNLGSLSHRIVAQYGNTPLGMVNATYEFLEIFRELGFSNLVISLKASKPLIMIQAYEGMVKRMMENKMSYPLHIGITEAGEGENGRIKSALGICSLLNKGIGDTLRVSLTEDPEKEIPFAMKLSSVYQIPFTKTDSSKHFFLNDSDFSSEEITFPDKKLKTLVISDISSSATSASLNSWDNENAIEPIPNDRTADLYFARNGQMPSLYPNRQFLIPVNNWMENPVSNAIPVIEITEGVLPEIPENSDRFFYRISCHDNISTSMVSKHHALMGIIADMNSCDEVEIQQWVNFSQQNQIPIIIRKSFPTADSNELISHLAIFSGNHLLEKKIQGLWINAPAIKENVTDLAFGFLQSAGLRITRTEFISCPTCARTSYDLQQVLKDVQKHTSHLPGLKIAVMGCIVNGPGEMADADFGFVGTGAGKLHLYKGKNPVKKNIDPADAPKALVEILKENGYNFPE
jgi:(E)-4-hydroxy-3-methylbut-2-enyl-diphosphate synthase